MSTIGPSDPHLNITGLDRLGGQTALDDLQRQGPQPGADAAREAQRSADTGTVQPPVDAGEHVLAAVAWDGIDPGARLLAGDPAFERDLGTLDLSDAADRATDAILDALA